MARLTISLLGPFHVTLGSYAVTQFAYDKVRALLAYLVVEADRPHQREVLAELLWPDQPAATARHSLSQALTKLRQAIGDRGATPPYLLTSRDTVRFNGASEHTTDIAAFIALIDACTQHPHQQRETCTPCIQRLEQAVELYCGEFLAQFTLSDSAAFEEWLLLRREWLQQRALDALAWLTDAYEQHEAYERASQYARRQIALDPWREDAYRQLMRISASSGQRPAALRQYEQVRRVLLDELGVEPDVATTALYERIRAGEYGSKAAQAQGGKDGDERADAPARWRQAPASPVVRHNLPPATTPFVGRDQELAEIAALLNNPDCRLITVVGPGGIGKTRLSQQVARARIDAFAHGVWFVPLAPLRAVDQLVTTIADALQLPLFGHGNPLDDLRHYLHDKQMLLVLDNVEHLLDGVSILADLLESAPDIKLLVTSRERLNLQSEWVYAVEGLGVPEVDVSFPIEKYSAVQLFVQSARRVSSQFELHADELRCIGHICRLVDGMPLAIELAAAWVVVLPCREIAQEIARNLDFLATSLRDLPERHRSVRAVFDHSWNLLTERDRGVFRKLSVFRGGFNRGAAEQVADGSVSVLAVLVAKSLLHRTPAGRYEIHELLRQYGETKLREQPDQDRQTRDRHAAAYMQFLVQRESRLRGRDQQVALQEIAEDMDNIRAAWSWTVECCDLNSIAQSIDSLWYYFASRGNARDAQLLYDEAASRLERMNDLTRAGADERDRLLGKLYTGLATWHYRLGDFTHARWLLEHNMGLLRRLDAQRELGFALHHLAATVHLQGAYRDEQQLLQESIALSEAAGDHWLTGYSLNDLGLCTHILGHADQARSLCQESLTIFEALDDLRGIAFALDNLGVIAAIQDDYAEAERMHHASLTLRRANDDRWGIASSLTHLGAVAQVAGRHHEAYAYLLDALRTADEIRAFPLVTNALIELANVLVSQGELEHAHILVRAALRHPALMPEARHKGEQLLAGLGLSEQPAPLSFDGIIADLLATTPIAATPAIA
jgi:predicted ATPase/DNA-binding SARP family transcriptional activator